MGSLNNFLVNNCFMVYGYHDVKIKYVFFSFNKINSGIGLVMLKNVYDI